MNVFMMNSVAFHPMGYHVAIVFASRIQVCIVLHNKLKDEYTLPIKQATDIKYSNGGSLLAAASGQVITVRDDGDDV